MARKKSVLVTTLDAFQAKLTPTLKAWGFRVRGRNYNRTTSDGLTEVVNLNMGPFDPPSATHMAGLTDNFNAYFAVEVGVFIPEVWTDGRDFALPRFLATGHCGVRSQIGGPFIRSESLAAQGAQLVSRIKEGAASDRGISWKVASDDALVGEIVQRLEEEALPFFHRFETRDKILHEWLVVRDWVRAGLQDCPLTSTPTRIACAWILLKRGQRADATALLAAQVRAAVASGHQGHAESVRNRAVLRGLGDLGV